MNNPLFTNDLEPVVLFNPAQQFNRLKIITAYTDCDRIATHLIGLYDGIDEEIYQKDLSIEIIVGMIHSGKAGINPKKHDEICKLINRLNSSKGMPKVSCHYIITGKQVHSKVYIWHNKKEKLAFCGSANYTTFAFKKRRECMTECNPDLALRYFNELKKDTINCFDKNVENVLKKVKQTEEIQPFEPEEILLDYEHYNQLIPQDTINISLLVAKGDRTGYGSGVNWGIRKTGLKRNTNQAYIPYNDQDKKAGFFPDRINPTDKHCPIFKVITKDFGSFHMRLAQGKKGKNKALHTAESNAILGEWIRRKLKAEDGEFITKEMLENYGKTFVTFRKYDDGVYLLDF